MDRREMSICAIHKMCGDLRHSPYELLYPGRPNLVLPICSVCAITFKNNPRFRELITAHFEVTRKKMGSPLQLRRAPLVAEHGIPWQTEPNAYLVALQAIIDNYLE